MTKEQNKYIKQDLSGFLANPKWNEILPTLTKYQRDKHKDKIGIYLIKLGNLIYIGQTTTSFNERFSSHKRELLKALVEITSIPKNPELWQNETLYLTMAEYGFAYIVNQMPQKIDLNIDTLFINSEIINSIEYYLIEAYDKDYFGNLNKHTLQKTFYDIEHSYIKKYQSIKYGFNQFEILEFIRSKVRINKILSDMEFKKWKRLLIDFLNETIKIKYRLIELKKQGNLSDEEIANQIINEIGQFYHYKLMETNDKIARYVETSLNFDYNQMIESISIIQTIQQIPYKESEMDDEKEQDFN